MIGEMTISREVVKTVELQDRCFSAADLGFDLPDYRGVVLEANCAVLKGMKDPQITSVLDNALYQDTALNGDLSLLRNFYTVQFCQKTENVMTGGQMQNTVKYGGCGHEGRQGFCL